MRMNTQLVLIITTSQILKVPSIEQLAIFKSLKGFPELPNTVPTKSINPFKQVQNPQNRTIPAAIQKMDRIMKNMDVNIPLEFRTFIG